MKPNCWNSLVVILMGLLCTPAQAGTPINRDAVLEVITAPEFGLLRLKDFSAIKIKGKVAYTTQNNITKARPYLVTVIGPKEAVESVLVMGGLTNDNQLFLPLMLAAVASTVAPDHQALGAWVLNNITDLASKDGGTTKTVVDGKKFELSLTPPNIVMMNIEIK